MNLPSEVKLTTRQRRAIPLVLSASTLTEGLKAAGIGRTTWWNWKGQETFLRACQAWEDACFAESLQRAKLANLKAIDKIAELISHHDPRVALQACQALVPYSLRLSETLDLKRELAEIRKRLGMDQSGRK